MGRRNTRWMRWLKDNPELAIGAMPVFLEGAYRPRELWTSMTGKCISEKSECYVDREWMDYGTFLEWYDENYEPFYELDKDVLVEGNKMYSPDTCAFIPPKLNVLFRNRKGDKSTGLSGVKVSGKYFVAASKVGGIYLNLGKFHTKEEAYKVVLLNKYLYALEILEEYPCKDTRVVQAIKSRIESLDFSA